MLVWLDFTHQSIEAEGIFAIHSSVFKAQTNFWKNQLNKRFRLIALNCLINLDFVQFSARLSWSHDALMVIQKRLSVFELCRILYYDYYNDPLLSRLDTVKTKYLNIACNITKASNGPSMHKQILDSNHVPYWHRLKSNSHKTAYAREDLKEQKTSSKAASFNKTNLNIWAFSGRTKHGQLKGGGVLLRLIVTCYGTHPFTKGRPYWTDEVFPTRKRRSFLQKCHWFPHHKKQFTSESWFLLANSLELWISSWRACLNLISNKLITVWFAVAVSSLCILQLDLQPRFDPEEWNVNTL